jgi:hypothetical protein
MSAIARRSAPFRHASGGGLAVCPLWLWASPDGPAGFASRSAHARAASTQGSRSACGAMRGGREWWYGAKMGSAAGGGGASDLYTHKFISVQCDARIRDVRGMHHVCAQETMRATAGRERQASRRDDGQGRDSRWMGVDGVLLCVLSHRRARGARGPQRKASRSAGADSGLRAGSECGASHNYSCSRACERRWIERAGRRVGVLRCGRFACRGAADTERTSTARTKGGWPERSVWRPAALRSHRRKVAPRLPHSAHPCIRENKTAYLHRVEESQARVLHRECSCVPPFSPTPSLVLAREDVPDP